LRLILSGLAALAMTTTIASAGGLDRSGLPTSILFEDGSVARLSFSSATPSVSGTYIPALAPFGASTENMAESYASLGFALKLDLNDRMSVALMANQPFGADAKYTGGFYTGLEAHWTSNQIAAVLKYDLGERVSVYGGLRYVTSNATIDIPVLMLSPPVTPAVIGPYSATASSNSQLGYLVGAAYEIPAIALRGSLTYQSAITHDFATAESFGGVLGTATENSVTDIVIPQSVTFDFQSGIAADTLLFGSIKWTEWSKWHVRPAYYDRILNDEVTGFDNDVMSYQLGIGRKINDNLSLFARVGYEAATGDVASRLSPTDGMQSIGIGGSWTQDNIKITGGLEYVKLGDAVDGSGTEFSGNSAMGVGLSVDFTF
jgi:long-chain fatty acid transport protein